MTSRASRASLLAFVFFSILSIACTGGLSSPLGTEYEYEEDLTLSLDGSARLVVNASIPALVALRDLPLSLDPKIRADQLKDQVRSVYASDQTRVGRINTWVRHGRRFVGINIAVNDVRTLPKLAPFSWASYDLHQEGEQAVFRQTLSKPASAALGLAGLTGDEIVAFRVHLPARIRFQNSRYLNKDESRPAARGNIVTWEQRLADRLQGQPIAYAEDKKPDVMEVRMDRESILYRTLWLFGIAFAAALIVLAGLIWMTMRHGSNQDPASPASSSPLH